MGLLGFSLIFFSEPKVLVPTVNTFFFLLTAYRLINHQLTYSHFIEFPHLSNKAPSGVGRLLSQHKIKWTLLLQY